MRTDHRLAAHPLTQVAIAMVAAGVLLGCSQRASAMPMVEQPDAMAVPIVYQPAGRPIGRIILLHSLNTDQTLFSDPSTVTGNFRVQLVQAGWQVVVPALPFDGPDETTDIAAALSGDDGALYRALWDATSDQLVAWANEVYGPLPLVVGGFSWGGWHALEMASRTNVVGWFGEIPLVNMGALKEFAGENSSATDLSAQNVAALGGAPGMIGYGEYDTAVDPAASVTLASAVDADGGSVDLREYPIGHDFSAEACSDVLVWLHARFP